MFYTMAHSIKLIIINTQFVCMCMCIYDKDNTTRAGTPRHPPVGWVPLFLLAGTYGPGGGLRRGALRTAVPQLRGAPGQGLPPPASFVGARCPKPFAPISHSH